MANPSTVWAQLALPYTPVGDVPFVDVDNITIVTEHLYFNYCSSTATPSTPDVKAKQLTAFGGIRVGYSDTSNVPGNAIINKPAGIVPIGAAGQTVQVNSIYCTARSIVLCQLMTADATLKSVTVVVADGVFVITGNAATTGAVKVGFFILNTG